MCKILDSTDSMLYSNISQAELEGEAISAPAQGPTGSRPRKGQRSPGRCLLDASAASALPGNLRGPILPPVPPG